MIRSLVISLVITTCWVSTLGILSNRHNSEMTKAQGETRFWRMKARAKQPAQLFAIRMERGTCPKLLTFMGKLEGERWHEYSVEYTHRYGVGGYRFLVDGLQPPVVVDDKDGENPNRAVIFEAPSHYWIWEMADFAAARFHFRDLDPVEYAGWVGLDELIYESW